jgi:CMP/dCMP kinase
MNKINIAIDGAAATGKSTLAKRLAKALDYIYIDTGAMFRAITFFGLEQHPKGEINVPLLVASLSEISIHFEETPSGQRTFLNGVDVTQALRNPEINAKVSAVAVLPEIRSFLLDIQQQLGEDKGVVMDGRDIGTVVFPKAECKFFLTASPEIRARRRFNEQLADGIDESYEAVLQNVKARDHQDSTRAIAPLTKAVDALEIDVSDLSIEAVYQVMTHHISEKGWTKQ